MLQPDRAGSWTGPPADVLERLEQHLCRCRNRTLLFGGNDEAVLAHGPVGLAGRVVDTALAFLNERRPAKADRWPKKIDLAKVIDQPVGRLLAGQPPAGAVWMKKARTLLGYLCTGGREVPPDQQAVADRIDDYFFREYSPGWPWSAFFQPWRLRQSGPCSKTELAGEMHWLAREKELSPGRPVRLVWVLGTSPFPTDPSPYLDAVAHCLEAGVDVAVVYTDQRPAGGAGPKPSDSLRGFGRNGKARKVELGKPGRDGEPPAAGWWGFVTPVFQYLYFDTGHDEALFVLRGPENDKERAHSPTPFAFHAHASERTAFHEWLAVIDPPRSARRG